MVTVIPGANISSPNVNTGRQYIDGRNIQLLEKIGAVSAAEAQLFTRVDGIIDSQPANRRPEVDEMVRLEQPNYTATLFPAEQALQPGLWSHLEWDQVPAATPAPQIPTLQGSVRDITTSPAALDFTLQVPIASLSQPLQATAQRLQLVHNSDSQATTISLADVDAAAAADGRFLPQEVQQFEAIRKEIRLAAHTNVNDRAQIEVPRPGTRNITLQHPGQVAFQLQSVTSLTETRTRSVDHGRGTQYRFNVNIELKRDWNNTVVVPANHDAIVINLANGGEKHFPAGTNEMNLGAGDYRVELWRNGNRIESSEVQIPPTKAERINLRDNVDYDFVLPNGTPLARNVTEATRTTLNRRQRQTTSTVKFDHWLNARPDQNVQDPSILPEVQSPTINLAPGTYQIQPNVTVDVFAQNVMRVNLGQTAVPMVPYLGSNRAAFSRTPGSHNINFDYGKNEIRIANRNGNRPIKITRDMRIG